MTFKKLNKDIFIIIKLILVPQVRNSTTELTLMYPVLYWSDNNLPNFSKTLQPNLSHVNS